MDEIQSMSAIELKSVTKRYGTTAAVDAVTLDLAAGQTVALVGHNGAGKTTLFKLMLGLTRPTAGEIRVLGEDPGTGAGREARNNMGYLPENVVFSGALSGREMLRFYASMKGRGPSECDRLLERVGLGEARDKRVNAYSKGMRQRLGLAQALLGEPRLLFLDEPTTGLDPLVRQSFYDLVGELRGRGVTALLSSHALSELEARIDHVVILDRGTVLAAGSLDALRALAGLPIQIELAVSKEFTSDLDGLDGLSAVPTGMNGHRSLTCTSERKLDLVRRVSALPHVTNISIIEPTLDQIYAHFLSDRRSER
jgi:Cu-processing system ATP-binding protein